MQAKPLLTVAGLDYAYGKVKVLRGMSLTVAAGEVVTVLGSNGAGKSTTAKLISGVLRKQSGSIVFDGSDISGMPCHEVVERGITLVPEGRMIFPRMTVLENLQIGGSPRRAASRYVENSARVFELFPRLSDRRSQIAGSMSGGEQQMLAIARGLMTNPKLMILDEPSLGLMPTMVEKLFELITIISGMGISLILVEQNAFQSLSIAHRAYIIERGAVTAEGEAAKFLNDDFVRRAFLGH